MSPDFTRCLPEDIQILAIAINQVKVGQGFHSLPSLSKIARLLMKQRKVHDFTRFEQGQDYVFDPIDATQGYMTGQGKRIRRGDYILLQPRSEVEWYQVEAIDYYANPSDMWIALLLRVNNQT